MHIQRHMNTYTHKQTCACIHAHTHAQTQTYTYTHACAHTHTHVYTQSCFVLFHCFPSQFFSPCSLFLVIFLALNSSCSAFMTSIFLYRLLFPSLLLDTFIEHVAFVFQSLAYFPQESDVQLYPLFLWVLEFYFSLLWNKIPVCIYTQFLYPFIRWCLDLFCILIIANSGVIIIDVQKSLTHWHWTLGVYQEVV